MTADLHELQFSHSMKKLDQISQRLLESEIIDSNWEFEQRWADLHTLESPVDIFAYIILPVKFVYLEPNRCRPCTNTFSDTILN